MSKSNALSSKFRCMFRPLLMLAVLSTLALSGCGTTQTASVGQCPPIPKADSSLLTKPQGLATYQLPAPPSSLPDAAKAEVVLSDVAREHVQEDAYTLWLEKVVKGWQAWYADLVKTYGPVSGPQ